jgi:hypothetical protein
MWLGTIICIVIIILLLIVCCYYLWNQISTAKPNVNIQFDPYLEGRPHVFRDATGIIRPEGSPSGIAGYESYQPDQILRR